MRNETTIGGFSLCDIFLVVFVVLKLIGVINWSWWIVLIPLWIELGIFVIMLLTMIVVIIKNR